MEVLKQVDCGVQLVVKYRDMTYWHGNDVKLKDEKDIMAPLGWWYYRHIRDLFNSDKCKYEFLKQPLDLDKILSGENSKLISRIYKWLLKRFTEEEVVKTQRSDGEKTLIV